MAEYCIGDDEAGYLLIILNRQSECGGEWTYLLQLSNLINEAICLHGLF